MLRVTVFLCSLWGGGFFFFFLRCTLLWILLIYYLKKNNNNSQTLADELYRSHLKHVILFCMNQNKVTNERLKQLTDQILELDSLHSQTPSPSLPKQHLLLQTEYYLLTTQQVESFEIIRKKLGKLLARQLHHKSSSQAIPEISELQDNKHTHGM